ncbi:hypothetical protein LTR66_015900, partial [Elasticomyces elasticus]
MIELDSDDTSGEMDKQSDSEHYFDTSGSSGLCDITNTVEKTTSINDAWQSMLILHKLPAFLQVLEIIVDDADLYDDFLTLLTCPDAEKHLLILREVLVVLDVAASAETVAKYLELRDLKRKLVML